MAVSDAQKRATAKWDKANRKNVSCMISTAEHAAFKVYAEARGKTISGLLLDYVRSCISEDTEQPGKLEQPQKADQWKPLTQDEIISLMSIEGSDNIISAVAGIGAERAKEYLMFTLMIYDQKRKIDREIANRKRERLEQKSETGAK